MQTKKCQHKNHEGEQILPITEFRRNKNTQDGFQPYCKNCCKRQQRSYYQRNKNTIKQKVKTYQQSHPDVHRKAQSKWIAKNPNYAQSYYSINQTKIKEQSKNWYEINKTSVLTRYHDNPIFYNQKAKQWRKNNPHKVNANISKRRAQKISATPKWFEKDKIEQLYEHCHFLTITSGIQHHVDHIVPLKHTKVCGLHCLSNLQILQSVDNLLKSNKWEID